MKKEHIVKAMIEIIKNKTESLNLNVEDKGTGHAFENTFWDGLIEDKSDIPEIKAYNDNYSIGLRSFWGSPELCIRRHSEANNGKEEMLILCYSDFEYDDIEHTSYTHTDNFYVDEIRCNTHGNYKACIDEIYDIIEQIANLVELYELGDNR